MIGRPKETGAHRLEFYFADGGVGTLVTDDRAKLDQWWKTFVNPLVESGHQDRAVAVAMFVNGYFVREHQYDHMRPVA
jgi:hypothetical protein